MTRQKVHMPEGDDRIEVKHLSNVNDCPIRIYVDFETINDLFTSNKSIGDSRLKTR